MKAAGRRTPVIIDDKSLKEAVITLLRVASLWSNGALAQTHPRVREEHEALLQHVIALAEDHFAKVPIEKHGKTLAHASDAAFAEMRARIARQLRPHAKTATSGTVVEEIKEKLWLIVKALWPLETAPDFSTAWQTLQRWLSTPRVQGEGSRAVAVGNFVEQLGGPKPDHLARISPGAKSSRGAEPSSTTRMFGNDPSCGMSGLQSALDWKRYSLDIIGAKVVDGEICVSGPGAILQYLDGDEEPLVRWEELAPDEPTNVKIDKKSTSRSRSPRKR